MDRSLPQVPGWYVDMDDPSRLRHWSGWGWDLKSRRLPEWMRQTRVFAVRRPGVDRAGHPDLGPRPDGKVELEALRATYLPAAAGSARLGAARAHPAAVAAGAGRGAGRLGQQQRSRDVTSVRIVRPRPARRTPLMAGTAFLGVIAVLLIAVLGTTRTPLTTAGDDTAAFTHSANIACAAAGSGRATPAAGAIPGVATVTAANASLFRLRSQLATLVAASPTEPAVRVWLDDWKTYAGERLQAATDDTRAAGATAAVADESRAVQVESKADDFALANALGECTLDPATPSLRKF